MVDCRAYLNFLDRVQHHEIDLIMQVSIKSFHDPIEIRDYFGSRVVCFHSDNWAGINTNTLDAKLRPEQNIRFVDIDCTEVQMDSWWEENEGVDIDTLLLGLDGGEKNLAVLKSLGHLLNKIEYIIVSINPTEGWYSKFDKLLSEWDFEGIDLESYSGRFQMALFRKTMKVKQH